MWYENADMPRVDIASVGKRRRKPPPDALSGKPLRDALVAVAGSQAKFAELLGVSENAVTGWRKRGAPGFVMAYLRLHGEAADLRLRMMEMAAQMLAVAQGRSK